MLLIDKNVGEFVELMSYANIFLGERSHDIEALISCEPTLGILERLNIHLGKSTITHLLANLTLLPKDFLASIPERDYMKSIPYVLIVGSLMYVHYIHIYGKCGPLMDSISILGTLSQHDVITWDTIICSGF